MSIRTLLVSLIAAALAGCGAETLGTAATGAAIKKQELEQGRKTLEHSRHKLEQALQAEPRQPAD